MRKIILNAIVVSGLGLITADLTAQNLCRNNSNGQVRWVSGSSCPSGFSVINNSVREGHLRNGSVTTAKIANNAVTTAKIADGAVTDAKIQDVAFSKVTGVSITDAHVASGANINHSKIDFTGWSAPANSVTGASVQDGSLTHADLASNANIKWSQLDQSTIPVQSGVLGNNSVQTIHIADDAVTSAKILNGTIVDADIAGNAAIAFSKISVPNNAITGSMIDQSSLSLASIGGTIGTAQIANNAVTSAKIAAGAVDSTKLANNSVSGGLGGVIQDGTITDDDISPTANIAGTKIASGSITHTQLANNAVTTSKIDNLAVTDAKLADDAVTTNKIATAAVTGPKIANNAIGTAQLANDAVVSSKIQDGAVTITKIQDGAVGPTKLAANAVTSNAILNGAVTDLKLANDSVSTAKIQDGAVNAAKLAPNSVSGGTGGVIADLSITNADISNTAAIAHTKLDFTGWTVPANMVNTASIQNNAVTNAKIDIDLGYDLPYITFVGKSDTNLSTSATQFLFPVGKVTPSTSNDLWTNIEGCTKFALKVELTAAPGGSASRTFRLHNGSGTIGTACTITGSSTSCATSEFTVTLPSAFQISSEVSGSPAAAGASWVVVCSQ